MTGKIHDHFISGTALFTKQKHKEKISFFKEKISQHAEERNRYERNRDLTCGVFREKHRYYRMKVSGHLNVE